MSKEEIIELIKQMIEENNKELSKKIVEEQIDNIATSLARKINRSFLIE